MIARRKSDGKIIEVKKWRGASGVVYSSPDMNRFYQASDLDFNMDADTVIQGWVVIQDFPAYLINRDGEIWSTLTNKKIKPAKHKSGYMLVGLRKNNISRTCKLHRLIAKAFIPNPDNKPFIDHINGVRDDNRIENLRWCTNQENKSFPLARLHNRECRIGIPQSKEALEARTKVFQDKYGKQVAQYTIDGKLIKVFQSINEASRYYKIKPSIISLCCRGENHNAGGFVWRFIDKEVPETICVTPYCKSNRRKCEECSFCDLSHNTPYCKLKDAYARYYACHKFKAK